MRVSNSYCEGEGVIDYVKKKRAEDYFTLSAQMVLYTLFICVFYVFLFGFQDQKEETTVEKTCSIASTLLLGAATVWFVGDMAGWWKRLKRRFTDDPTDDPTDGGVWIDVIYIVILIVLIIIMRFINPLIISLIYSIILIAYTLYMYLSICTPDCTEIKDKDDCNSIGKICSDTDMTDSDCGSCSDSEKVTEGDCSGENDVWTSKLSSCFWNSPDKNVMDRITDPDITIEEKCIYNLNKCEGVCDTFSPTNLFSDCCEIDNWKIWMDEMSLEIIQKRNKKGSEVDIITIEDLAIEYNLRGASGEEYSRREEMEQGLYA